MKVTEKKKLQGIVDNLKRSLRRIDEDMYSDSVKAECGRMHRWVTSLQECLNESPK